MCGNWCGVKSTAHWRARNWIDSGCAWAAPQMNTPAHLILGMAAFGRPNQPRLTAAAVAGALAPDISLYLMTAVSLFVMEIPPQRVFGELYFSGAWQQVFAIDNSFVLWGLLFGLSLYGRWRVGIAFAGAALLHLALDFPLHNDDGRPHFWPLSDWVYESPVSYWDRDHHAEIIAPVEMLLATGICAWMLPRFKSLWARVLIVTLGALELAPGIVWLFVFTNPA